MLAEKVWALTRFPLFDCQLMYSYRRVIRRAVWCYHPLRSVEEDQDDFSWLFSSVSLKYDLRGLSALSFLAHFQTCHKGSELIFVIMRSHQIILRNIGTKLQPPPPPQPPTQMLLVMLSILTEYYRVLVSSQCQCIFSKMGICSVDHWLGIIFLSVGYWVWLWFLSK